MAVFTQSVSAADVLAGLTTDDTQWAGANIANLDYLLSTLRTQLFTTVYQKTAHVWNQTDGTLQYTLTVAPQTVGKWYLRGTFTTLGNSGDAIQFIPYYYDTDNFFLMQLRDSDAATSDLVFNKTQAASSTTLIARGTATSGTDEHYYEVTRTGLGDFELFEDGTSIGTAADEFFPAPGDVKAYVRFSDSTGGSVFSMAEIKHTDLAVI